MKLNGSIKSDLKKVVLYFSPNLRITLLIEVVLIKWCGIMIQQQIGINLFQPLS